MEDREAELEEFAGDGRQRLARIETRLDDATHDTRQFPLLLLGAVLTIMLTVIGIALAM